MACCPLCGEDVQVGTAGPQGLKQHQGKKKCLANIEKKKKEEQKGKNLTLFSFLQCQHCQDKIHSSIWIASISRWHLEIGVVQTMLKSAARPTKHQHQ